MFPDRRAAVFWTRPSCRGWRAFPLFARRPMQGNVSGRHPSPHRGSSVEFAEYRKYVPGDDLRRLDWRAYGRSDRFFVKEFEADTNLRCCLVLDTSGSMDFGSAGVTKLEYARRIAGALGLSGPSAGGRGRPGLRRRRDRAQHPAPAQSVAPDDASSTSSNRRSRRARPSSSRCCTSWPRRSAQRALIVIISDLFVEPEAAPRLLPAPAVPPARRGDLPSARPAGDGLRLPPADAVPRHGRGARRSSPSPTRSPTAISKALAGYLDGAQAGRARIGRRLSPGDDRREL